MLSISGLTHGQRVWKACLLGLALLAAACAGATEPTAVLLESSFAKAALESHMLYVCPPHNVDDMATARLLDYRPLPKATISFGYRASPCWFRFRLSNTSTSKLALIVNIDFSVLDHVQLFIPGDAHNQILTSGSAEPYEKRPLRMRSISFPLQLDALHTQDYYLRVATHTPLAVPISLSSQAAFTEERISQEWWQGVFFGIGAGLFLYNLFLWQAVREKSYGYYLAHLSFALLFFGAIQGISYSWWPDWPEWNSRAPHVFFYGFLFAGTLFAREFLRTQQWLRIDRLLITVASLLLIVGIATLVLPMEHMTRFLPALIMLDMPLLLYVGIRCWRAGQPQAPFFVIAWGFFLLPETLVALSAYGFFFGLEKSLTFMQVGFSAQLVLLSLALANRINTLKDEQHFREREAQLARAENSAKSAFLATMSHEIRTPMNAVMGITQLLRDTPLNKDQRDYIDMLQSAGQLLLNIINNVLDYSRIAAGKLDLECVDFRLQDTITETINILSPIARRKSLTLEAEIAPDLPEWLSGDPLRLQQIILNLVGNALKFTEHGHVLLRASSLPGESDNDIFLNIQVVDSGIGISSEDSQYLFQDFSQANASVPHKYGGSGLGLSISKKLAEMMGGKIGMSSRPGQGSTFWFTAFLKKARAPEAMANGRKNENHGHQGLRVLVVEDNSVNQLVIVGLLRKLGIEPAVCSNGEEAIALLELGDGADLVLMDCEMPVMDGYEATRRIRMRESRLGLPAVIIIALTAHAVQEHHDKCLAAGMNDFLSKPVTLRELLVKLDRWHPQG